MHFFASTLDSHYKKHPSSTLADLQRAFPLRVQKKMEIVLDEAQAHKQNMDGKGKPRKNYHIFEQVKLPNGAALAVCNQWGVANIGDFLDHAKLMGYQIGLEGRPSESVSTPTKMPRTTTTPKSVAEIMELISEVRAADEHAATARARASGKGEIMAEAQAADKWTAVRIAIYEAIPKSAAEIVMLVDEARAATKHAATIKSGIGVVAQAEAMDKWREAMQALYEANKLNGQSSRNSTERIKTCDTCSHHNPSDLICSRYRRGNVACADYV